MASFFDQYLQNLKFNAPAMFNAGGALAQGQAGYNAGQYNAQQRTMEGNAAMDQALAQEAQTRVKNREDLGKQAAAVGAAGIGYGGSSGRVMDQSAVNSELDALNVRYRGAFTKYGYDAEAALAKYQGNVSRVNSYLKAGGAIISGKSTGYVPGDN
jgi:hypothetical protein